VTEDNYHARTKELAEAILALIRQNYLAGPLSRDRAYEALNALAVVAGTVLAGCDETGEEWFLMALKQQLDGVRRALGQ
jgi:hypothetical protein